MIKSHDPALSLVIFLSTICTPLTAAAGAPPQRSLAICVSSKAPEAIQAAAQAVLGAVRSHPLLIAMAGGRAPSAINNTEGLMDGPAESRAYSNLVVIGTPDDPAVAAVWQHQAKPEPGGFYIFGFGHLRGDIGYIESDRNPFLHGAAIKSAPFETEVATITGSTTAGVVLAVDAFLKQGLVNRVVAANGWTRPSTTILDRAPLPPDFALPSWMPARAGSATILGVTQAGEDEYRGVLADTDVEPQWIWRIKYYHDGDWDGAGAVNAFADYSNGLQRLAYGNTIWCAQFASTAEAEHAAPRIAAAAGLSRSRNVWTGAQPPFGAANALAQPASPGSLALWSRGDRVFMSTLPAADTTDLYASMDGNRIGN